MNMKEKAVFFHELYNFITKLYSKTISLLKRSSMGIFVIAKRAFVRLIGNGAALFYLGSKYLAPCLIYLSYMEAILVQRKQW